MSALFEIPLASETLEASELCSITGCPRKADQVKWLEDNQWVHHKTRSGEAVVGRLYARMKMAGITPTGGGAAPAWTPDYSTLN